MSASPFNNIRFSVFSLISGLLLFYLPLIYSFPIFYNDDYYIFYKIASNPVLPLTTEAGEKFFLFLRPVTYAYFWLLYTVFGTSSLLMKFVGLSVTIATFTITLLAIERANRRFSLHINSTVAALLCLAFAVHRDFAHGVLWISNMNEILAVFFYVLIIYILLRETITKRTIVLVLILYLASIFSKQQGMHIPLLLTVYYYIYGKALDEQSQRNLKLLLLFSFFVFIVAGIINFSFLAADSDFSFLDALWKKPFSILGTILYMLFPLFGEEVYVYFLLNKTYAFVGAALLLFATGFVLLKHRDFLKRKMSTIITLLILCTIIFFPRIFAAGAERLNGIQLVWLVFVLAYLFSKLKPAVSVVVCLVMLVQNGLSSITLRNELLDNESNLQRLKNMIQWYSESGENRICIIPSIANYWNIPYMMESNGKKFSKNDNVIFTGVMAYNPENKRFENTISVVRNHELITVSAEKSSSTYFLLYRNSNIEVLSREEGSVRGYRSLSFRLPDSLHTADIVQYDGHQLVKK